MHLRRGVRVAHLGVAARRVGGHPIEIFGQSRRAELAQGGLIPLLEGFGGGAVIVGALAVGGDGWSAFGGKLPAVDLSVAPSFCARVFGGQLGVEFVAEGHDVARVRP